MSYSRFLSRTTSNVDSRLGQLSQMPMSQVETEFDAMNNEELLNFINEQKRIASLAKLENIYIKRFLQANDPNFVPVIHTLEDRKIQFADTEGTKTIYNDKFAANINKVSPKLSLNMAKSEDQFSMKSTLTSYSRHMSIRTFDSVIHNEPEINLSMKLEMISKAIADCKARKTQKEFETKKILRNLNATVDELKLTNRETIETIVTFEDYVVTKGIDPLTQRIPSERFIKFYTNWVKSGMSIVEKMRLKTSTLRKNAAHQKSLLAIKAELSGILRPIDFEQLQIKKYDFQITIEEKNAHLIGLKRVKGNAALALANQRKMLLDTMAKLESVINKSKECESQIARLKAEANLVEAETVTCNGNIEKLLEQMKTYKAPSALEYAKLKTSLRNLEKDLKLAKRKNYISKIKLNNTKTKLKMKRIQDRRERQRAEKIKNQFKSLFN